MFQKFAKLWQDIRPEQPDGVLPEQGGGSDLAFAKMLSEAGKDPYVCVADEALRLISVFDDLRYDRADMDLLSRPMRQRVITWLAPLGVRQVSGNVLEHADLNIRLLMPKFRALGASPFDATHDTPRGSHDYFILTPTQTAAFLATHHQTDVAVSAIETLIAQQPVNLLRLADYLEATAQHQAFADAIGHLRWIQRQAIESEPLNRRRALR